MNIRLKSNVNHDGDSYDAGTELFGMDDDQAQQLVDAGVAEVIDEKQKKQPKKVDLKKNDEGKDEEQDGDEDEDEEEQTEEVPTKAKLMKNSRAVLVNLAKDRDVENVDFEDEKNVTKSVISDAILETYKPVEE